MPYEVERYSRVPVLWVLLWVNAFGTWHRFGTILPPFASRISNRVKILIFLLALECSQFFQEPTSFLVLRLYI